MLAALKVLRDLLKDSGWTSALVQAGVATAFLKAAHITPTRVLTRLQLLPYINQ